VVTESELEVLGLAKTYPGGVEAVKPLAFEVARGEVFGLLGPNGAGKSTTVGMLTTTIRPTAGTARLAGFDIVTEPLAARNVSSVVFQEPVVDRALTGRRNLELHARLWRVEPETARERIGDLTASFGLDGLLDRPVDGYSGGERRRLEIARALVSRPRVLFLDEPTVGLDPLMRVELLDVLTGLREREDVTIVLTTHYLEEAERLCDRLAVIDRGTIVALETPTALLTALGDEIVELRVDGSAELALAALQSVGVVDGDGFAVGSTLTLPLRNRTPAEALAAIGRTGVVASAISTRRPTLDDVYLRLTGGRLAEAV
jgi:ABC-2 type transport system ATP-binding protein